MRHLFFVLVFLFAFVKMQGQEILKTNEQVNGFRNISQEHVFVHVNTTFLLTGESLYYKLYCFIRNQNVVSTLSKIAYIELAGKDGTIVFKHKIRLEDGQGYGDFFIPTSVPSGSYKLLGYTNWMRNGAISDFFQADITIINPYQSNQSGIQMVNSVENDSIFNKGQLVGQVISSKDANSSVYAGPIEISVGKKHFKKRTKVSLVLKGKNTLSNVSGNYSISVRKKDSLKGVLPQRSNEFFNTSAIKEIGYAHGKDHSVYLPELRGELFCGKVEAVNDSYRVNNLKIAVSVPGENTYVDVIATDAVGGFCFNVNEDYTGDKMVFQVLSDHPERYKVALKTEDHMAYSELTFNDVDISSAMKNEILKRSVHNQIEHSYFQFRPDSLRSKPTEELFDKKERKVFLLDNFTRFKTVEETILEIIKDVSTQRMGKDDFVIKVKGFDYATASELLPFILLDGYFVQNHNALLKYDARSIESITVMQHKLIFGPEVFLGVLIIKTKKRNGKAILEERAASSVITIFKPQRNKSYFAQSYDDVGPISKLPDDRLQLLWMPNLRPSTDKINIDFFTSDVSGEFEIQIEGFTEENHPVTIRESIFVD